MSDASPSLLVTGGAGFIGSCFVALALRHGARVVVLDALTYAGGEDNLEGLDATFVKGSIGDGALVARLLREHAITQVVNFAAESHVDSSIVSPAVFVDTNIVGIFTLLEACRAYAAEVGAFRFLQVSTDEVFGSVEAGAAGLDSPYRPNSPYSASKAAGDHLVRAWGKTYGLDVVTTHCSNNYGPRQHPEKLIPAMITAALAGKPLRVYGTGVQVRDWLHVEDHCDGIWLALTRAESESVHHFSGGEGRRNLVLVREICAVLDALAPKERPHAEKIVFVEDRPGHDLRYALDDAVTRKALGFAPKHRLSEGLRATVEWYLANREWCAQRAMRMA